MSLMCLKSPLKLTLTDHNTSTLEAVDTLEALEVEDDP